MTHKEQIAETLYRLAEVKERMARLAKARAARAADDAEAEVEAVAEQQREGEKSLGDGGATLSGAERELLWSHRSHVQHERTRAEAVLEERRHRADAADQTHRGREQQRQVKERIYDHIRAAARAEAEKRTQDEQDDLTAARWSRR